MEKIWIRDQRSGMEKIWIRDPGPGMEKIRILDQVSGINILDQQNWKEPNKNQTLCGKDILG
jgi:hypothetical protein